MAFAVPQSIRAVPTDTDGSIFLDVFRNPRYLFRLCSRKSNIQNLGISCPAQTVHPCFSWRLTLESSLRLAECKSSSSHFFRGSAISRQKFPSPAPCRFVVERSLHIALAGTILPSHDPPILAPSDGPQVPSTTHIVTVEPITRALADDSASSLNGTAPRKPLRKTSKLLSRALEKIESASVGSGGPAAVVESPAIDAEAQRKKRVRRKKAEPAADEVAPAPKAAAPTGKTVEAEERRIYVLDTNVILHDSSCLMHFGPHDVVIPITVLEELDKFKKGNEVINFHAREFLRMADDLTQGEGLFTDEGVSLGSGLGHMRIVLTGLTGKRPGDDSDSNVFQQAFYQDVPDHRILRVVYDLARQQAARAMLAAELDGSEPIEKPKQVVLVTKDVNLRMKARALGLAAQDYQSDRDVMSISQLYTGKRVVDNVPGKVIDDLYREPFRVARELLDDVLSDPMPNENFILRGGASKSVLAYYDATDNMYVRVGKEPACRISPRNAEQAFALAALLNPKVNLVSVAGSAGTGKTLLALAAALEQQAKYQQIYLARPIVPLSNRDLGYLPGDMNAKIDPYMQPLYDNLGVIRNHISQGNGGDLDPNGKNGKNKKGSGGGTGAGGGKLDIPNLLDSEKLVITPLAYIRGRSFQEVFFIVDEAQNLTPLEVKTIITRAGEGTKIVFTGDVQQIDTPYLDRLSNGLSYLINRMSGQPVYAHVTLEKGERSTLAKLASDLL